MITLEHDRLHFRFPEVHEEAHCTISFQRTLRIPDDGESYPLPPGLGGFPLRHVDDHARRLPGEWLRRGGVLMPMHQAEAMWMGFDSPSEDEGYPFAVKIATGKVCAVSGEAWQDHLNQDPQDYVVLPDQPWLDGYCVEKGMIRQFVAMPLGEGYTVEEQLTGAGEHGGVQIVACPMKRDRYESLLARRARRLEGAGPMHALACTMPSMGLAPGGRMRQEIYDDPHGLDAWDQRHASRCFVTTANSTQWMAMTGERPPTDPPTAREYSEAGLPWFEYYGGDTEALEGAERFKSLASVSEISGQKGGKPLPENESVAETRVVRLRKQGARQVREP